MSWDVIGVYAVAVCLLIGAVFSIVGSIGLVRFDDSMNRLHAPTKVGTVGVGAMLVASMIYSFVFADGSFHELLILAFLFVTAPISALFIGKVHLHRNDDVNPPKPTDDAQWATLVRKAEKPTAQEP